MAELTKEELKWVRRVQRALNACPSDRIGFFTIGDHDVTLYNRDLSEEIDAIYDSKGADFCVAVSEADADFGKQLMFPSHVHSTAG